MFQSTRSVLKQKKGSVAVLLMCIMGSFIFIVSVLVAASVSASGKSYADATLQLSGKSILSEYDRRLLDDYGILAFRGDEDDIEKKIRFYANGSFNDHWPEYFVLSSNKEKTRLLKLNMNNMEVNLKEYSMVNVDLYEDQIREALKTTIFDNNDRTEHEKSKNRVLRNEVVIDNLPSAGYKGSALPDFSEMKDIPEWEKVLDGAGSKFARCEYVMKVFKHANVGNLDKETFFNNEIEYILEGRKSDVQNYDAIKNKLYLIRMTLNTIHISRDKVKMAEIKTIAAASQAAGVPEPLTEIGLIALWAGAETENDIDLLESGEKVALWKATGRQWALDNLQEIIEGVAQEEGVLPESKEGLDYGQYLRVFLYLEDREAMLLRMMDLTQINMKGTYYRDFLLKEHFAGFRFNTFIRGDEFSYAQKY